MEFRFAPHAWPTRIVFQWKICKESGEMMTSRERVLRALEFNEVDRVPIEVSLGPEMEARFPSDVSSPRYTFGPGKSRGRSFVKGRYMDLWGCFWEAAENGVCGESVDHPLRKDWSALADFQPPWDVLEQADVSLVNGDCAGSDRFMIPMWGGGANLFERMQHLRGTEQLLMDLAYLEPEVYQLRDMVHDYFLRQLGLWMKTDVDAIHLHDDWGTQQSMLISPVLWREFFKPVYKDYCDLAHRHGKKVLMHSDGFIMDIIPDLIEIGLDALNAQIFCMDIEQLGERFRGRICFWGEIDRQYLLTRGTPEEVRAAVRRVAKAFMPEKKTGVVGMCFGGLGGTDHKWENMVAVYDEWSKI